MANQIVRKGAGVSNKSRLQLRYEQLLNEIELKKKHQENLEAGMRIVIPKIEAEIKPLMQKEREWHKKKIIRLDEVADELKVGKYNKEWFDQYMTEETAQLLADSNGKDEELQAIYKKYAGEEFAFDHDEKAMMAQVIKEQFGFDIDVDEMMEKGMENYMKENAENFSKQIQEQQEKEEAEAQAEAEAAHKRKSPKQLAREKKEAEEQKMLEQDAKAIYMRLIKKYHPDRTQDADKQKEFTEITMQVTKAYQENDFLQLLKLQIQYLEEGEKDASALAEDMLKRYNKILQKQLDELEEELEDLKFSSMGLFEDFFDKNHKFSTAKFNRYKKGIEERINSIQNDLNDSVKKKKTWFKDWIAEIKALRQQNMMQDIFAQMFGDRF